MILIKVMILLTKILIGHGDKYYWFFGFDYSDGFHTCGDVNDWFDLEGVESNT